MTPNAARHWGITHVFPHGTRHAGREWAFQFLFQSEFNRLDSLEASLALFWEEHQLNFDADLERLAHAVGPIPPVAMKEIAKLRRQASRFAEKLIRGVLATHPELDAAIADASAHWGIDRMGTADRNILRLGAYELLHHPDVPPAVAINEAVELAKTYSSFESGRFVNGILDHIHKNPPPSTAPASGGEPDDALPPPSDDAPAPDDA
ncbi:MAG: transcription antitermination factor NusB [Kiritimatiellae bacterium]|nr:transcription antitermination factor NusB [Kiritimatiellia bacterium]